MSLDLAWHRGAALSHDNGEVSPGKAGGLYEAPQVKSFFVEFFFAAFSIGQLPLLRTSYVRLNNARRVSAFMA